MSEKRKMGLKGAEALANRMIQVLKPVCQRIEVAGSIRRRKETIGDVEIVCIPNEFVSDLFGNKDYDIEAVYQALRAYDCEIIKGGQKYICAVRLGVQYDIFIATRDTWGCVYLIRTGSADFTRKIVTQKSYGGYCPNELYFHDARMWSRKDSSKPLDTPEEEDVFKAIGLPYVAPEDRWI